MGKSHKSRNRSLQYEALEARQVMAAGITASLSSVGVLTVNGTENADAINFRQIGGMISVAGVSGSFSATNVKSIVVNCKGGNDIVSLNSLTNGGNQTLAEEFTVNSGAGSDKVRLANANELTMSGAGHAIKVSTAGVAAVDGVQINFSSTIQTSYSAGVLTVTGTNGNDSIKFLRKNNVITIAGVAGSWSALSVTSLVVNLQNGNDTVSLNSLANGGNQALGIAVTVRSGAGNDKVSLADGHDVTFSGAGHVVTVTANGTPKLDGQAINWGNNPTPNPPAPTPPAPTPPAPTPPSNNNWFDTHVNDAALRSLGHTLFTDGLINRTDMIALLRSAEDGGIIDGTELADLRAIDAATSLFGTLDYVQKLTGYIVNGSVANRTYQGQTLGGFGVGSADTQMEKLINKWFLGLDHPTATGAYRQFAGTLFVNGPTYSDIHQGAVGDCYFVSSLGEVALKNPSAITNMFVVNGDGTYTVKFYGPFGADYVTVDAYLPTNANGQLIYASRGASYTNAGNELWVALAEKAYAQLNQFGWSRGGSSDNGANSYAGLSGGYINAALSHITGQSTVNFAMTSGASSFQTFVNAYNAGKSIGFASYQTPPSSSVVGGHAYAVVGYYAAAKTVTLFNPWGTEYGLVTMTWAQIQQNFQYYDRTA
jgi:Calpain family cysteine protease